MAKLTFYGAAQEVTGSCHLLESPSCGRILLDCGMHQGGDAVKRIQKDTFHFIPSSIDAVVLSHAHLDHSGLLPKLVHQGFSGKIHCTEATVELLEIMLNDSVGLYERDLEHKNRHRKRQGKKPLKPEYVRNDVNKVLNLCKAHQYNDKQTLGKKARLTFYDAGHILGSAIVEIILEEKKQKKTLVFSGDLGNKNAVLMNDPVILNDASVVLMESTYGNRNHRAAEATLEQLKKIIKDARQRKGNIMIPAFAVGRTQEFLFHLGRLYHQGELRDWQIFLDSPMAISVTRVYDRWLEQMDPGDIKALDDADKESLRTFLPTLRPTVTPEESMAINKIKNGAIIIAGSGMCTGGRIRHHFKHRIWNERNTIIFAGFQARGTLGRSLVDGTKHIKLFKEDYVVKAKIETLGGFSAHAGQNELVEWVSHFRTKPKVILVHGEAEALDVLSQKLWDEKGISAEIPMLEQSIAF